MFEDYCIGVLGCIPAKNSPDYSRLKAAWRGWKSLDKPLKRKAYGSIGHLPNSRLGPGDHKVPEGQAQICTEKVRDKHDIVICQEKLDGSCTAVALLDGRLHALGRAGWPAESSRHIQHRMFAQWVWNNEDRFRSILREGERIVGEWLAQAHGTLYDLNEWEDPWFAFDIMVGSDRIDYGEFLGRVAHTFEIPHLLHMGGAISTEKAMEIHKKICLPCDQIEGVVYRVERKGRVDFLAKYVRPDKIDGQYLDKDIWNWRLTNFG